MLLARQSPQTRAQGRRYGARRNGTRAQSGRAPPHRTKGAPAGDVFREAFGARPRAFDRAPHDVSRASGFLGTAREDPREEIPRTFQAENLSRRRIYPRAKECRGPEAQSGGILTKRHHGNNRSSSGHKRRGKGRPHKRRTRLLSRHGGRGSALQHTQPAEQETKAGAVQSTAEGDRLRSGKKPYRRRSPSAVLCTENRCHSKISSH